MKGHVNSSGFPLQIGIKRKVDATTDQHGWKTLYTEHAWTNQYSGESGFIDLVLSNQAGTIFFNVECKRVLDTSWIFITEKAGNQNRRHAKCFVFSQSGNSIKWFEWADLTLEPSTPESQFCVIPGTGNNKRTLIERSAAELVFSTEGLAAEQKSITRPSGETLCIYFNVIVTTAKLNLCLFDSANIDLKDGSVSDPYFKEIPYIRFRKQLKEVPPNLEKYSDPYGINLERIKESTVFVVNAENLLRFLEEFEVDNSYTNNKYFR